jgi:hypothetical protein
MACNCEIFECLSVDYNPCDNGIELPLNADETGDWVLLIEFNGTWIRLVVEVENGEPIVIQNVLNENYVHTIRLLNTEKELFNDTCYKLITKVVDGTGIVAPGGSGSEMEVQPALDFTTGPATTQYQSDLLIGAVIISVELEGLPYTNYTFDDETGIITTPLLLPDGGTLRVIYKK